jgi:hypothetical protein
MEGPMAEVDAKTIAKEEVSGTVKDLIYDDGATKITVTKVAENVYRIEAVIPD